MWIIYIQRNNNLPSVDSLQFTTSLGCTVEAVSRCAPLTSKTYDADVNDEFFWSLVLVCYIFPVAQHESIVVVKVPSRTSFSHLTVLKNNKWLL